MRPTACGDSPPTVRACRSFAPVATFRKIMSPQIIGVDPLYAGSGSFHAMFVVSNSEHPSGVMGRPSPKPPKPPRPRPPRPKPPRPAGAAGGGGGGDGGGASDRHVAPQDTGRPVSVLTPLRDGPRQCGQSPATSASLARRVTRDIETKTYRMKDSWMKTAYGAGSHLDASGVHYASALQSASSVRTPLRR